MKRENREVESARKARSEAPRNRLLLWLAAGLAPESAPWFFGYTQPLYRHIETLRTDAGVLAAQALQVEEAEEPAEAPRRAA
jgi:hypothetical protein